jgi:hypothetical protein
VFTQRGPMACQGWRWIYVRLRQGLRRECRRKRNAKSNHKSVCDNQSLAPDFSSNSIARPSHELGLAQLSPLTGNVPIKSPALRFEARFPGDAFALHTWATAAQHNFRNPSFIRQLRISHEDRAFLRTEWTAYPQESEPRQIRFPVLFS